MKRYVLLLFVVFSCMWGNVFAANIGYVWMTRFADDYQYSENTLPDVGQIVKLNELLGFTPNTDDDLMFNGLHVVKVVVDDYLKKSISSKCSQLELRGSMSAYLSNSYGKECGIGSLKQYSFHKFDATQKFKILSYEHIDEEVMFILIQQIN